MSEYAFPDKLYTLFSGSRPITQIVRAGDLTIKCIPVFTEQLLAERWIDWQRLKCPDLIMGVATVAQAIELLGQVPDRVAAHVILDASPENKQGTKIWTIQKAIQLMEADQS